MQQQRGKAPCHPTYPVGEPILAPVTIHDFSSAEGAGRLLLRDKPYVPSLFLGSGIQQVGEFLVGTGADLAES